MGWVVFIPPRDGRGVCVCQPPAQQDGLAGEPWPSAQPGGQGVSTMWLQLPVQSCILGRQARDVSWLPPKLHHTSLFVGNGKGLHSTSQCMFLPGVVGSTHQWVGLGVGPVPVQQWS